MSIHWLITDASELRGGTYVHLHTKKKKKKEFTEVFPEARWTAKTTNRKEPLAEGTWCEKGLCLQSSRVSQALGLDENNFAKVW